MTKPIIVVKVPCKLLYVIQVKEFLIKCSTSWPYLISEFLVAYITIVASDWPRTFFTPKVFLFSIHKIKRDDRGKLQLHGTLSSLIFVKLNLPEKEQPCYDFHPSPQLLKLAKKATSHYNKVVCGHSSKQ